ncbi:MAG: nuclear transport factor 2 family protein [Pseudomonadota bacterium]
MSESTLLDELAQCETAVWQALVDGHAAADASALHDRFLGVYPSGFADKAAHVGQLADGPTIARFALSDLRLGPDHALLSYHARFCRPHGKDEEMYVSSVWMRSDTGWRNLFSQDTPVA